MANSIDTTRRSAIKALSVFGIAAVPTASMAGQSMTAQAAMKFHLEEFKKAAMRHDPTITGWRGGEPAFAHPHDVVAISITALRSRKA